MANDCLRSAADPNAVHIQPRPEAPCASVTRTVASGRIGPPRQRPAPPPAGAALVGGPAAPEASAATAVSVTVNGTAGLGAIPGGAIGLNTAVYDGYMNDTPIPVGVRGKGFAGSAVRR